MGRSELERLSREELIELVLQLQGPGSFANLFGTICNGPRAGEGRL